jgi:uncharacterized protein with HEPN domain
MFDFNYYNNLYNKITNYIPTINNDSLNFGRINGNKKFFRPSTDYYYEGVDATTEGAEKGPNGADRLLKSKATPEQRQKFDILANKKQNVIAQDIAKNKITNHTTNQNNIQKNIINTTQPQYNKTPLNFIKSPDTARTIVIRRDIQKVNDIIKNNSIDDIKKNDVLKNALKMHAISIGEHSKKFSDEFKELYSDINWDALKESRNALAHNNPMDIEKIHDLLKDSASKFKQINIKQIQESKPPDIENMFKEFHHNKEQLRQAFANGENVNYKSDLVDKYNKSRHNMLNVAKNMYYNAVDSNDEESMQKFNRMRNIAEDRRFRDKSRQRGVCLAKINKFI